MAQSYLKTSLWNLLFLLPKGLVHKVFQSKWLLSIGYGGSFAAYRMDLELAKLMPYEAGFFIEIGGNDGISQSNTKWLELYRNWRGILVEPHPANFKRMKITRHPRTGLFQGACVPFDYEQNEVLLTYLDLMTTSDSLETDLADKAAHIEAATGWIRAGRKASSFSAPALYLNDLLEQTGAPALIDFFSLDVEGAELPVLRGVDHSRYKFKYLLIESRSPYDLEDFLVPLGYVLERQLLGGDYLYRYSQ